MIHLQITDIANESRTVDYYTRKATPYRMACSALAHLHNYHGRVHIIADYYAPPDTTQYSVYTYYYARHLRRYVFRSEYKMRIVN